MQYILTKEELDNLVPQVRLYDEQKKVEMLVEEFKKTTKCWKENHGYCDQCPIASLNNRFNRQICHTEKYSK
jgi:hypothetical protein